MQPPNTNTTPLSNLSKTLEKARVEGGIPGWSVAILHKGDLIFAEGFGKRNELEPFTTETLAPIGSLTKAFTASAIGELVAEGKMDWDTTAVSKYLPEFELQDPVLTSQLTLVDLLSHRTSLPDIDLAWFRNTESRRDLIKRLKHVKMDSKLRTKCNYSNVMYAVAGEAAANVVGISYENVVETKILQRLDLTDSGFSSMEMKTRSNYAMPYDAASFSDAQNGVFEQGYLDEIYMTDAPAGDMYSNVLDLVKWGRVIMKHGELDGKQVLNKDSVEEMLSGHSFMRSKKGAPESPPVTAYGMGFVLDSYKGHVLYRHGGSVPGFRANLAIFPDVDLVIAQLANIDVSDLLNQLPYYIADELLALTKTKDWFEAAISNTHSDYEELASLVKQDLPKQILNKSPAHALEGYVGEYTNAILGDVSVRMGKDDDTDERSLVFKLRLFESKLMHHHFDTFSVVLNDFAVEIGALVSFLTDSHGGTVAGFTVEVADMLEGVHEFKRKD
ncbi:hypothetical protein BGZ58_000191 [Dissophora ornata]|nr:hypothetical protein BGZ58_000191 [Dissophora ornata]